MSDRAAELADRIEKSMGISLSEQPKIPGPVWAIPLSDEDAALIAEALRCLPKIAREKEITRLATIEECAEKIGSMRQSEAGLFDAAHSGQRGEDRSNALYDAYQAIRALGRPA